MVVGKLVFISFSVSFSVFMCLSVSLVSHVCTITLESQLISLSSNVHFLVTQISFVIKYIRGRFSSRPQKFLRKEEKRWRIMYDLLLNRSYDWLNIHNLDKYRTKLKNLCFRKWKQQKRNNKRKLQSKLSRFIITTNYLVHSPNILKKQIKQE